MTDEELKILKEQIKKEMYEEVFSKPLAEGQGPPYNPIVIYNEYKYYSLVNMTKTHTETNTNQVIKPTGDAPITQTGVSGKPKINIFKENNTKIVIIGIILVVYLIGGILIFYQSKSKINILPFLTPVLEGFIK